MGPSVLVAMSGGVDSSVAACLLQEQGYEVIGSHMRLVHLDGVEHGCCGPAARADAAEVARIAGIEFEVSDMTLAFDDAVIDDFVKEHRAGRTPNPCARCNGEIKFGAFLRRADELGIDRCHLVIHDIGGPVGAEWAVRNPDRVLSLTVLNTPLNVATFHRPWSMHPFSIARVGELYLRSMSRFALVQLFYLQGIGDRTAVSRDEIGVYYDLLKREDGGRAFLKIMRGFELTEEKQDLLWSGLAERPYPAAVVWGKDDPALGMDLCQIACDVLDVDEPNLVPAKHFLQEDQAPAIAGAVAAIA